MRGGRDVVWRMGKAIWLAPHQKRGQGGEGGSWEEREEGEEWKKRGVRKAFHLHVHLLLAGKVIWHAEILLGYHFDRFDLARQTAIVSKIENGTSRQSVVGPLSAFCQPSKALKLSVVKP
eukprot:4650771-Pleurochrysis_carterae.AAC.1